jgi:hypothetical protein
MSNFIITKPNGTTFDLYDKTIPSTILSGSQNCRLLSEDTLAIQTKSARPLPLSIGDTCTVYGKIYRINTQPSVKKQGPRKFITDIVFEGVQYELLDAQFLLPENTIGDSFTGNLEDFLNILIGNANRVGTWITGNYPVDTEYKTLTFTGENCLSVLKRICEEWEQEFEIEQSDGKNILHIQTAGEDFPYTFKYGSTGGLYALTRKNIDSENIVTRLYAYGGSNNLGNGYLSNRGCGKLCLPEKTKNDSFIQSDEALQNYGLKENTKVFDKIFPNRYGTVTALGEDYLSFIDDTMNFDLNEKETDGTTTKWLIAGVAAKVHFNTGNLAGYEFELEKYDHTTKTLKIIPFEDENGMKFPNPDSEAFQFSTDNEYFFVDIRLPQAYIDEAEEKLQAEAEAYYLQNSQPRVQYELNIHDIFLKQFAGNITIANLFVVGDYIPVQDSDIGVDKSIRLTGFTRDILKPYKYDITLGEAVTKTTITRIIKDQRSVEEIIRFNKLNDPSRARRNWRASQEVLSMVFDPEGDYYSDKIKPLSIETTMLQAGAKSMQFVLLNVVFEPNYQGDPNVIRVGGGQLVHYTIEDKIKTWNIATETVSGLQSETPYYIYARCSKTENAGNILIDTTQRGVDYEDGYYTFTVGVLNSVETDGDGSNPGRLVSLTYGSSTISGRFIKTGRIESSGGTGSFIDLDNNQARLGTQNKGLSWNIDNNGNLVIHGGLVQSQSGDVQPLGFFRGEYNNAYTYYEGDQVNYQGSTYRFIYPTPQTGKLPTDTTYWTVSAAKGEPGADGQSPDWKTFAYKKSATNPGKPTDTTPIPQGWQDYPDSEATGDDKWWMVVAIVHWTDTGWLAGAFIDDVFTPGQWSEPITVTGEQGTDGQYIDFKFSATSNTNPPTWNDTLASMLNPTGWSDQPPQLPVGGAIWMIEAYKQAGGTQMITTWSAPVRISGEKGFDGQDGQDGANGMYTSFVFKISDMQPATPAGTSPIPFGWSDVPTAFSSNISNISHDPTWTLQADGTRKSPAISDSGFTKNRINFTTSQADQAIVIDLKVSSESGYDFALVGLLDNPNLSRTENYTDRISGETEKYISVNIPQAGTHFIDIGYGKDGSQSTGQDCAWYGISYGSACWMSKSAVVYQNGQWLAGEWSAPVKITGEDGEAGTDGKFWDYKYRVSATQPATPSGLSPSGWSDAPPTVTDGNYLWMSFCEKNAAQTEILQNWSTPVRISGEKGQDGLSVYYLDLDNENASVAADYNGNPVSDTYPSCNASLYLGSSKVTTGVTFKYVVSGCTINLATGSYIAGSSFTLTGITADKATVTVTARIGGSDIMSSVMNIIRVKAGTPGANAIIYWLQPSVSVIKKSASGTITPASVTCAAYQRTGTGSVQTAQNVTVKYQLSTGSLLNYSGAVGIPTDAEYIEFSLVNSANNILDIERVPVVSDGQDGAGGAYFEYRYAKSTSPTEYPALAIISLAPSGWTTTMPSVGTLEYLWMTVARKSASGALIQGWSVPVRASGVDGANGDTGPSLVYRGVYSSSETYYGTARRVDAVKYNNTYYVARVDAGDGFSGQTPTNTSYWNTFGAQFDSVATGLLLAELAYIENLMVRRLSSGTDDSLSRLLATGGEIRFYRNKSEEISGLGAPLRLGVDVGEQDYIFEDSIPGLSAKNYSSGRHSEITSSGIFTDGSNVRGLRIDFGDPPNYYGSYYSAMSLVSLLKSRSPGLSSNKISINAAIYGDDQTDDYAASYSEGYGGYFNKLRANGLCIGFRFINSTPDSPTYVTLLPTDVYLVFGNSSGTLYLPLGEEYEGRTIYLKRVGAGTATVRGYDSATPIFTNTFIGTALSLNLGETYMFVYGKFTQSGNSGQKGTWVANKMGV